MTILVCGEALYDLFQVAEPSPGTLSFEARVGGSPFNVAIGIARLGGDAALLTGLSADMLGERLFNRLTDEGVDTRYLVRNDRRTTLSLVGLDPAGQPDYAFYGVGSADCALTVADMPSLPASVNALHFGSYSLALPPVADALAALAAKHRERFISLDPNVRPTIEPDMAIWRARIDAMRHHANLIKVSAEDLEMLYPDASPASIAESWLDDGCDLVLVTAGAGQVGIFRPANTLHHTPAPVEVVDTVGAGDTFQASFLAGLQRRGTYAVTPEALPDDALIEEVGRAARAAGMTCTRRGADLPYAAELGLPTRG